MADLLTFTANTIEVLPWSDSNADGDGHVPTGEYAEYFWLPSLGPSAMWMLRRLSQYFVSEPGGFSLDLPAFASQLGLGNGTARQSPFRRAFERLVLFDLASPVSTTTLYVRRTVPSISRRQLMKLPSSLREFHAEFDSETQERVPVSEMRSRAFHIAISMRANGSDAQEISAQLMQWHFHPAIVHEAIRRAEISSETDSTVA